jgi:hypothetical protein
MGWDTSTFNAYKPFEDSCLFRNFEFSQQDVGADGQINTGVLHQSLCGPVVVQFPLKYRFTYPSTAAPIVPVLGSAPWTSFFPYNTADDPLGALNITAASGNYYMTNTTPNYFGLAYLSAIFAYQQGGTLHFDTLASGGSIPANGGYVYPQTDTPVLQTVAYYFARPGTDPLPGNSAFSPTNTTPPVMLAGFGQNFHLAGYAKQQLRNGSANVFAYLGQYFEQAYTIDTSGAVTTNLAGILSPYGAFFPTNVGPAALVTMTNWGANERGTGVVNVIKLQLDVNHDGTMDLSFGGPDNTSQGRPFVFWLNNDYDRVWRDADDGAYYDDSVTAAQGNNIPDSNYTNSVGYRAIPTMRDLQDFARLWTSGISNLYSKLPPGSTVSLSWGDVGSPNPANPTIDLFEAADPDGATGYLTNATLASQQIDPTQALYKGRLGPGQSLRLDSCLFGPCCRGDHFIWCGVSSGTGALTLTIADAQSKVLAQTMAYIQLQDIKQMYERWTVGERPNVAPANTAYLAEEDVDQPFHYGSNSDTNTPYILFVHGWNLQQWEKDRFAESAFKRLYWQGYQGRFGLFRWPTTYGFTGSFWQLATDSYNYNNGESNAWNSASGLLNKLNDLNTKYPGHVYLLAHSMGNVVAGEALRLAGSTQVVNTYVASQAAIPAHVYDSTVTTLLQFQYQYPAGLLNRLGIVNYGPNTPNIYGNWLADNSGGVGRRINFYNANDWALAMPRWGFDQVVKPDEYLGSKYNYLGSPDDPPPWTNFVVVTLGGISYFDIANSVNDRYRVMAYAAQARSTPLGATPGITNLVSIDLTRTTPTRIWPVDSTGHSYADHFWHSAEFRGDYWQQQGYWNELLSSDVFGLK